MPKPQAGTKPKECDIVMKGGITSGVVYPGAICEIAAAYRFRSIGGTSAGAIAAAATAAAEYGRQNGVADSFETLGTLPRELGASADGGATTRLFHLFQPNRDARRLFDVVTAALRRTWTRDPDTGKVASEPLLERGFRALRAALGAAVGQSFNRITVDGDRSTNDTVLLLAGGAAGNRLLRPGHPDWERFTSALAALTTMRYRSLRRR